MNQTTRRTIITAAGAVGIASALPRFAIGQPAWPSKPIRIVVTNPAGGLTDQYARHYGEFLSRKFGQPVVVENKPGASGTIAADAVAKSAPDGHTLLVAIQTTVWTARNTRSSSPSANATLDWALRARSKIGRISWPER